MSSIVDDAANNRDFRNGFLLLFEILMGLTYKLNLG